jgi:O-succinylbenzoate synthase
MDPSSIVRAWLCRLPLKRPIPVGTARWTERPTILLSVTNGAGQTGWGEAAPLDGYGPDTLADVLHAIRSGDWAAPLPSLQCALGTARLVGHDPSGRLQVPAVLDVTSDAPLLKVKISGEPQDEASRLLGLLRDLPDRRLRLDANASMTRDGALRLLDALGAEAARVDFFEEPFPGCFDADHRTDFPVPLAIDESLAGENWRHADVAVIKPSLMGDPADTLVLAGRIQESGRRVVVSSAFESRVGMLMLVHLADRLGDAAPGLSTYTWLADDIGGLDPLLSGPVLDPQQLPAVPLPLADPSCAPFPVEVIR